MIIIPDYRCLCKASKSLKGICSKKSETNWVFPSKQTTGISKELKILFFCLSSIFNRLVQSPFDAGTTCKGNVSKPKSDQILSSFYSSSPRCKFKNPGTRWKEPIHLHPEASGCFPLTNHLRCTLGLGMIRLLSIPLPYQQEESFPICFMLCYYSKVRNPLQLSTPVCKNHRIVTKTTVSTSTFLILMMRNSGGTHQKINFFLKYLKLSSS